MSTVARLSFDGDLTIYHAAELKPRLIEAVRNNESLELDLSRVAEMDTAGVQLLVMAKRESQRLGHQLSMVGHSPAVQDVIGFYNMSGFFGDPVVISANQA